MFMKSIITLSTALTLYFLTGFCSKAQQLETQDSSPQLTIIKEQIIQEEKDALKTEVEAINSRLERKSITESEAETLKKAAAEKHALNIENRVAIASNEMELLNRNGSDSIKGNGSRIVIGLGQKDIDNDYIVGLKIQSKKDPEKKRKYDRRTTSGLVFAFGLNNVITEGESLDNSDYKIAGSRFTEMGWTWNTRVLKNSNWVRIKYGFSFQFNGLKPTDNRFLVDTGEQTELQEYPLNLSKSKFRIDNLVVPILFEFGPSKKKDYGDYFRYTTDKQFKFGLGGYGGIKLSSRQKLKYSENGNSQKDKLKANYNTNDFIYGVSGYVGVGGISLYAKYDLNTIFKNNPIDQRNVSLGLRFDFD